MNSAYPWCLLGLVASAGCSVPAAEPDSGSAGATGSTSTQEESSAANSSSGKEEGGVDATTSQTSGTLATSLGDGGSTVTDAVGTGLTTTGPGGTDESTTAGILSSGAETQTGASSDSDPSESSTGGDPPPISTEGDGDHTIGPNYQDAPELDNSGVPHGNLYTFVMRSSDSSIFRGDDSTLNQSREFTRNVRVYIPAQYEDGTPAPLLVVQDGYVEDIVRVLDSLAAAGSVPPFVPIFVDNGGGDGPGSQRGLEYDTLSDRYSRFITTEVLPAVEDNAEIRADYPNFALTTDPDGRGAYGCSSGGAAAFTMGWFSPDEFRRIITYSGTFVDQQDGDAPEEAQYPFGAWEYHERLIAENEPKPLRVFLHVGEDDLNANRPDDDHHNWVSANRRMAEDLADKGYHYRFVFAQNSGHCDGRVRRETLPDTLRWMWRGYEAL